MPRSFVVATAGHVDHGKSTLVRALTGMEPDRWAEERRRGLTIDLGFVWTTLGSGDRVAFVDVPGHERFLGNMLAGLGPAPVICFVVAADEGWSAQSGDHRDAIAALGISDGVVVISRVDRVSDNGARALAQTRAELADTGLADAPAVAVSAIEGTGVAELRQALDRVLTGLAEPNPQQRVRLWLDRAFSITGAGTVVTGTLSAGSLREGDELTLLAAHGAPRNVTVRGLQSGGRDFTRLDPTDRVAVNLRGVAADQVGRGDLLLTPGAWSLTSTVDVRRVGGVAWDRVPEVLTAHVGTAAVPLRLRPFGADHARLSLPRDLPLLVGDRLVLHDPGARRIVGGAQVLDPDPPELRRRGDGVRRASTLAATDPGGDVAATIARHEALEPATLERLGFAVAEQPPSGVVEVEGWWVDAAALQRWQQLLGDLVDRARATDPLAGGVPTGRLREELGATGGRFLDHLVVGVGLETAAGRVRRPGSQNDLGAAESAIAALEERLAKTPFGAPEAADLAGAGLGARELAAAERAGRLIRLGEGIVLLPTAPALAMRELVALDQPFTTSAARQALATTRRVVIPLLEHLDDRGWTRRIDAGHREIVR